MSRADLTDLTLRRRASEELVLLSWKSWNKWAISALRHGSLSRKMQSQLHQLLSWQYPPGSSVNPRFLKELLHCTRACSEALRMRAVFEKVSNAFVWLYTSSTSGRCLASWQFGFKNGVVLAPVDHCLDWLCSGPEYRDLKACLPERICCAFKELDSVVLPESSAEYFLSFLNFILHQGVACIGEVNNLHWGIELTDWGHEAKLEW